MAKTHNGHSWYESDLHLYTNEFLIEIIRDLLEDKQELENQDLPSRTHDALKEEVEE